ncbi:RES family NAD+ phosphorylase [Pseudomonas veronii]|uniref:RES family NAD+ phosphorylase n=1 Tax=Pseudomonas veronii TaxID=76761 RepID=UPI002D7A387E|nr:RES family NAD+ phosphorylase [Pseudomonas veronii]WRU62481.1 RES family NAD+ phosphorylase [Pseudomonas veronii]
MPNICIRCVKDSSLKQLINDEGSLGECSLCSSNELVLDAESRRFFQLTKALVRFHYSEWDYNHHWGGNGYASLFYGQDNRFFDEGRSKSDDAYEEIVLSITDGAVYEEYDKGISVFSGYDSDGQQNMLLQSISSDLNQSILTIAERLKKENHFNLESQVKDILEEYRVVGTTSIPVDNLLYRARVGFKERKRNISLGFEAEFHYVPHVGSDIGAPPPNLAMGGRVNRPGVSFLYCATDKHTAISEVRPHPGDRVSLAELRTNRNLSVFDLSDNKLHYFCDSDEALDKYRAFNTLGVLINKAIPPSERTHYSMTQLIADCIRQIGFDGIIFNSTVGSGKNIVIFDESLVDQIQSNADIVLISEVKYEYRKEYIVGDDDDYF